MQARGTFGVVAILIDDALRLLQIRLLCVWLPPVTQVTLYIELATLVVESVCDFMSNDITDGTEVHVLGSLGIEKVTLENASRELCVEQRNGNMIAYFQSWKSIHKFALVTNEPQPSHPSIYPQLHIDNSRMLFSSEE